MMHLRRQIRDISVEMLLAWTFGTQHAELEHREDRPRPACGTEYVILKRHLMGTSIDGGRGYLPDPTHDDAETVAAVVSGALRPQIARWVADLARSGRRPDGLICLVPRCMPRTWRQKVNRYEAKAETVQALPVLFEGGSWQPWMKIAARSRRAAINHGLAPFEANHREHLGHCTPVKYEPTKQQIDTARDAYLEWWAALHEVRERLTLGPVLREHRLTSQMPPPAPWVTDGRQMGGKPMVRVGG